MKVCMVTCSVPLMDVTPYPCCKSWLRRKKKGDSGACTYGNYTIPIIFQKKKKREKKTSKMNVPLMRILKKGKNKSS